MSAAQRVTRIRNGRGFIYRDSVSGERVTDRETISWIKGLAIPPAWTGTEITLSERTKILAIGYDAAGRKQYIYNPAFRARQEKAKFDRLLQFASRLPRMRRITGQHLRQEGFPREKVLACMVRLIDMAYFRVGSEQYAKDNKTYGLATMRSKHLTVEGDKLIFDYIGKAHQQQHREVEDRRLAKIVAELDELPGYEIFKYCDEDGTLTDVTSTELNAYIKEVMGEEFSAKDFRTWAGTLIAAVALDELHPDPGEPPLKKHVVEAVKRVAEHLGNTPSVARASYIDPRVIDHYLTGTTIKSFLGLIDEELEEAEELSDEERAVLGLLKKRLSRRAQGT